MRFPQSTPLRDSCLYQDEQPFLFFLSEILTSHADQLAKTFRRILDQGDDFFKKITLNASGDWALQRSLWRQMVGRGMLQCPQTTQAHLQVDQLTASRLASAFVNKLVPTSQPTNQGQFHSEKIKPMKGK
jgi:hypothetical protein